MKTICMIDHADGSTEHIYYNAFNGRVYSSKSKRPLLDGFKFNNYNDACFGYTETARNNPGMRMPAPNHKPKGAGS